MFRLIGLSAPQGQPQGAMGGQPQQLDPQFIPALAAALPAVISAAPTIIKAAESLGSLFGLSTQQGQPQGAMGGQPQQLSQQGVFGLPAPPSPSDVFRLIGLSAPQGQPQGAMGGQPQQLDPQFIPALAAALPAVISAAPTIIKAAESLGSLFGLSTQQGQPQGAMGGQPQGAMGGQPQQFGSSAGGPQPMMAGWR
ncbi:hypothetical protein WJ438_10005 [Streptomyces sp. GD-15H]|uniref:hypothetical protein n=1 Tax=Streptomyces sp. GD-15H TaxID=3129112 RepID=UPI0032441F2E